MKQLFFISAFVLSFVFMSGTAAQAQQHNTEGGIRWMNWEQVQKALKKEKKPVISDVYTTWCYWCKVMDKKTFTDQSIIDYINNNFYAVKFDAEHKEPILFKGNKYTYYGSGRRGANRLAIELLQNQLSFPTILYLDPDLNTILISPGYKTPKMLKKEMKFVKTGAYKTTPWNKYSGE